MYCPAPEVPIGRDLILVAVYSRVFRGGTSGKESACQCRRQKRPMLDPLEKEMATHSGILAWKISWTEGSGGLKSMGWLRVGHD